MAKIILPDAKTEFKNKSGHTLYVQGRLPKALEFPLGDVTATLVGGRMRGAGDRAFQPAFVVFTDAHNNVVARLPLYDGYYPVDYTRAATRLLKCTRPITIKEAKSKDGLWHWLLQRPVPQQRKNPFIRTQKALLPAKTVTLSGWKETPVGEYPPLHRLLGNFINNTVVLTHHHSQRTLQKLKTFDDYISTRVQRVTRSLNGMGLGLIFGYHLSLLAPKPRP